MQFDLGGLICFHLTVLGWVRLSGVWVRFGLVSQETQWALCVTACVQQACAVVHLLRDAFSEACDDHTAQQSLWLTLRPSHTDIISTSKS